MAPTITVSDATWHRLQRRAEPLVDRPEDVIQKLLDEVEQGQKGTKQVEKQYQPRHKYRRIAPGLLLPEREYARPVLEAVFELGGRGTMRQVLDIVEKKLAGKFRPDDLVHMQSGGIRWRNRAQFQRLKLVQEGLLRSDSDRGMWELSPEGRRQVEEWRRG